MRLHDVTPQGTLISQKISDSTLIVYCLGSYPVSIHRRGYYILTHFQNVWSLMRRVQYKWNSKAYHTIKGASGSFLAFSSARLTKSLSERRDVSSSSLAFDRLTPGTSWHVT